MENFIFCAVYMSGTTSVHSGTFTFSHMREGHVLSKLLNQVCIYMLDFCLVFLGKDVIEIEKTLNGSRIINLIFTLAKIRLNVYFLQLNAK